MSAHHPTPVSTAVHAIGPWSTAHRVLLALVFAAAVLVAAGITAGLLLRSGGGTAAPAPQQVVQQAPAGTGGLPAAQEHPCTRVRAATPC